MRFKKSVLFLHRWAGLITGAAVLIISLTGAVFVFETEIFALFHQRLLRVEPSHGPMLPATRLLAAAQTALGPDIRPGWIEGYGPDQSVQVSAYERDDSAGGIWYWDEMKVWKTAFINPYTGQALGVVDRRFEFFQMVRQLHQNLLLKYEYGHYIVAVTVLVFVAMLITGLVLWLPRNRAALRQRLKVAWGSGRRRLQFDLHVVSGIYIWIPVFIVAATGLSWSFPWWAGGINYILTGKAGNAWAEDPVIESTPADSAQAALAPLDIAFLEAQRRSRPGGSYSVNLPDDPKGVFTASYEEPVKSGWRTWSDLKFDRYSGKLLYSDLFRDRDARKRFSFSAYDIHVGKIFGWPTQILALSVCLLCALLPVTGFMMWRAKAVQRKAKSGAARASAAAPPQPRSQAHPSIPKR